MSTAFGAPEDGQAEGLAPCCRTGHLHAGTPRGRELRLPDGLPYYHAAPAAGSHEGEAPPRAVVIYADVFGWQLPNVRLIADALAARGLHAFVPDYFEGDSMPTGKSFLFFRLPS